MQRTKNERQGIQDSPEAVAAASGVDLGLELTTGFAANFIRRKAKQVCRRPEFSQSDVDDIAQILTMRLLETIDQFDPEQGEFNVFVTAVVDRYTANIVRDAAAEKRDRSSTDSLHMIVGEDEYGPVELINTLSADDSQLPNQRFSSIESVDTAIDVGEILLQLAPEDQELCERLKLHTISEIARETGEPRTTLNDRVSRIRQHFERAGF